MMSIDIRSPRRPFIEFRHRNGSPFYCREDRLVCVIGPENNNSTKVVYSNNNNATEESIFDAPETIAVDFPTFTGRGGALVQLNPAFVIAVRCETDGNAGISKVDLGCYQVYLRATQAEIVEKLQQSPHRR